MIQKTAFFLVAAFILGGCHNSKPKSDLEKMSYAAGVQLAEGLKSSKVKLDIRFVEAGVRDAFSDQAVMKPQEVQEALVRLSNEAQNVRMSSAAENLKQSDKFIEKYLNEPGFTKTKGGVLFKELKAGTGRKPESSDTVKIHYVAYTIEGKIIDSSVHRGQPSQVKLNAVIPGWREALPQMKVGAKWEIVLPPQLAYGESGLGNIPPNSALRFELELLEILKR